MTERAKIVNPDPKYSKVRVIQPTALGYLYVAATVRPGPRLLTVVLPDARRRELLRQLEQFAHELERFAEVVNVSVFRAIARPPTVRLGAVPRQLRPADFDVMVLVETVSPAAAREVQTTAAWSALINTMRSYAQRVHFVVARNVRRIGDVDTTRPGLFLFNHFAAEDPATMQELWDYLADWYAHETGLDNSVALAPLDDEPPDYAIINWARWDMSPLRHFWRQLLKRSFWSYVRANLKANRAVSMPIYCRLASHPRGTKKVRVEPIVASPEPVAVREARPREPEEDDQPRGGTAPG